MTTITEQKSPWVTARFSFDDLVEATQPIIQRQVLSISHQKPEAGIDSCWVTAAAEVWGTDRRNIYRWRKTGLTMSTADKVATYVGCHPVSIWGEEWFTGIGDE